MRILNRTRQLNLARLDKSLAQLPRDLSDVRDLFHRRANESRQAFPFWLANDAKTSTKSLRHVHRRVVWKRSADFGQRMIEREIMRDDSGERTRLACRKCQSGSD